MEIRPPSMNRIQKNTKAAKKEKNSIHHGFNDTIDEPSVTLIQQSSVVFAVDPMFTDLDEPSPQQQGIHKGLSLLDELEKLQKQLISGAVNQETILGIQNFVEKLPKNNLDEKLEELLLDIETRAVVELAKYHMNTRNY